MRLCTLCDYSTAWLHPPYHRLRLFLHRVLPGHPLLGADSAGKFGSDSLSCWTLSTASSALASRRCDGCGICPKREYKYAMISLEFRHHGPPWARQIAGCDSLVQLNICVEIKIVRVNEYIAVSYAIHMQRLRFRQPRPRFLTKLLTSGRRSSSSCCWLGRLWGLIQDRRAGYDQRARVLQITVCNLSIQHLTILLRDCWLC